MPHCAVIWCNNQSKNVNKRNCGVTYHRFPYDPFVKDKWILATGKLNWFPQKHDTICSKHFEESCFTLRTPNHTRISDDAVPTLNLHPILNEVTKTVSHVEPVMEASQDGKAVDPKSSQSSSDAKPIGATKDTPQTRKLKLLLNRSQNHLKKHKLELKRFRERNRRLLKKVAKMETIIKHLRGQPTLTKKEKMTMESALVKQFKTKVYTQHTCTPKANLPM